ncbi:MAG: MFS transporter [Candidatus Atribacteria bacterium]|nr:MFS transporter [Candidatus Atribacteria bacterium]
MSKNVLLLPFILGLIVIGFGLTGIGSVVPEIATQFHVSPGVIGQVFVFHGLGYFLSLMLAGFLGDLIQKGLILRLGLLISLIGFAGLAFLSHVTLNMFAFMAMGVGLGFLDCMINPIVISIFTRTPGTILSFIHAFYGFGSLSAPRLYAFLSERGFLWQDFYKLVAVITAVVLVIFLFPFIPKSKPSLGFRDILTLFRYRAFWYLGAASMLYAGGVMTLNGWIVSFFQEKGLPVTTGAVYLSFFWLGLMAGRLLLSRIVDRIGYLRMIQLNTIGGIVFVSLTLLFPTSGVLAPTFLFLAGFTLSTIIPTSLAYSVVNYPKTSSTASGWVLSTNGVGMLIFPWLGGIIASFTSFRVTLSTVPVLLTAMFLFQLLLAREVKKQ